MRPAILDETMRSVFGADDDRIEDVERRAREAYRGQRIIVWQGDPQTFIFDYVGGDAEVVLGHPAGDWLGEGFWAEHIVHPEDRDDAVAFCALATAKACDHEFEYRAVSHAGETVWFADIVRVIVGQRGIPTRLRGIMIDITERKRSEGRDSERATHRRPTQAELERFAE